MKKVGGLVDAAKEKAGQVIDAVADELRRDKEVIPYPTYGYQKQGDPGTWVIPLRVWVSKARRIPISDEVNERAKPDSLRLQGMTILETPTVVHGVTQFKD